MSVTYQILCKFSVESEVIIGGEEVEDEQTRWCKYPTPIIFCKIREEDNAEHLLQHLITLQIS